MISSCRLGAFLWVSCEFVICNVLSCIVSYLAQSEFNSNYDSVNQLVNNSVDTFIQVFSFAETYIASC